MLHHLSVEIDVASLLLKVYLTYLDGKYIDILENPQFEGGLDSFQNTVSFSVTSPNGRMTVFLETPSCDGSVFCTRFVDKVHQCITIEEQIYCEMLTPCTGFRVSHLSNHHISIIRITFRSNHCLTNDIAKSACRLIFLPLVILVGCYFSY